MTFIELEKALFGTNSNDIQNMNLLHTFFSTYNNIKVITIVKHFQERGLKDSKEIFYRGICESFKPKFTIFAQGGIQFHEKSIGLLYRSMLYDRNLVVAEG